MLVRDFASMSEGVLLEICAPIMHDPMVVQWVKGAASSSQLNTWMTEYGWSNENVIACKAAYHLKERFPDIWEKEIRQADLDSDRRFEWEFSPDLPSGFEMEKCVVLGDEKAMSDEPLLLREIRGSFTVGTEVKQVNSYDMGRKFEPQWIGHAMSDSFFWFDIGRCPSPPYFGQLQYDEAMKFEMLSEDKLLLPDQLSMYSWPVYYKSDKNKLPRHGKLLTLKQYHMVEDFYLLEQLYILVYKDFGSHADRTKFRRGEAKYFRKYFRQRRGHCLEVQFSIDTDWKLLTCIDGSKTYFGNLASPPEHGVSHPKWIPEDHETAFANIVLKHNNASLQDICGAEILKSPPAHILDLLI